MVGLPKGLKFAQGLAGLLGGLVLAAVATVIGVGAALGVGDGGIWNAILLFSLFLAVGAPLWYWILRPIFVWSYGERGAPWYRPPGTLHDNRLVRYVSIGGYTLAAVFVLAVFVVAGTGGGEQLTVGEQAEAEKLTASVTEVRTTDQLAETGSLGEDVSAANGATLVLVKFQVENTGETQAEAPGDTLLGDEIALRYRDTDPDAKNVGDFTAEGTAYTSYSEVVQEQDGSIFPGTTLSGWVVFELPEGFEREDAVFRVELGTESEVYEWTLA